MKSWKIRLVIAITMLAVILIVSVPAIAEDVEVECEAEDGVCKESVTWSSEFENEDSGLQEDAFDDAVAVESFEGCFPFCGLEWWPW